MTIFYALGGGWGHLKRVSVFARDLAVGDLKVLTANPVAFHLFEEEQVHVVDRSFEKSPEEFAQYLDSVVEGLKPDHFIVDVFPNGILGELGLMSSNVRMSLLCRYMKWEAYKSKASYGVKYSTTYIMEDLHPDHERYINDISSEIVAYNLEYPEPDMVQDPFSEKPAWLIVHGSSLSELQELVALAKSEALESGLDPKIYVCSDLDPGLQELTYLGPVMARPLMPYADRIFSGAGFNIMQETKGFRHKQVIYPFDRRYDDQYLRSERMT